MFYSIISSFLVSLITFMTIHDKAHTTSLTIRFSFLFFLGIQFIIWDSIKSSPFYPSKSFGHSLLLYSELMPYVTWLLLLHPYYQQVFLDLYYGSPKYWYIKSLWNFSWGIFPQKFFFLTFSFDLSCTISCTQTAVTLKRILSHSIPGPYYPCALVGPIVIGTTVGSLGQFFPTDKGLSAINNGLPWPIQGALMTSVFYHLTGAYCLSC